VLQTACKLLRFDHTAAVAILLHGCMAFYYSLLVGILHFLLRGGRLLVFSSEKSFECLHVYKIFERSFVFHDDVIVLS